MDAARSHRRRLLAEAARSRHLLSTARGWHLEMGAGGYRVISLRYSPPTKKSTPLWATSGRLTSLRTCRIVTRAT